MASSSSSRVIDLRTPEPRHEIRGREPTPAERCEGQIVDLTDDTGSDGFVVGQVTMLVHAQSANKLALSARPSFLVIQNLSAFWRDLIDRKMNLYTSSKRTRLDRDAGDKVMELADVPNPITLTVADFRRLLVLNHDPGYLNDNIIDAFLQTLGREVGKQAARTGANPLHHVFLPTQAATYLKDLGADASTANANNRAQARRSLNAILLKYGITKENVGEARNVYFPVHVQTKNGVGHWILGLWLPRLGRLRWYDSLRPKEGKIRPTEKTFGIGLGTFLSGDGEDSWREALPEHFIETAVVHCPQQKDETDCGVYTLAACLFRVLRYNGFVTGAGPENLLRPYFAAVILQGEWGGELPWWVPSPTTLPARYYEEIVEPGTPEYTLLK